MGRKAKAASGKSAHRQAHQRSGRAKKRGECNGEDFNDLVKQLKPLGLAVRIMDGDGNCLFRTFADQVGGDAEEHQQHRDECCEFMSENAAEFELFHADEDDQESESFDSYIAGMRHPGCWGSQLELMALCRRNNVNAIVHQLGSPAYEMVFAPREARCIQLSYQDGEHFNSIRFAWDLAAGQPAQHLSLLQLRGAGGEDDQEDSEDVRLVRECLPPGHEACAAAIRAALVRGEGDPTTAAEYILVDDYGDATSSAADPSCIVGVRSSAGPDGSVDLEAPEEAAAALETATAESTATTGKPASNSKASRPDKRSERRRVKETEKSRKAAAEHLQPSEVDEKLALLRNQLLSV